MALINGITSSTRSCAAAAARWPAATSVTPMMCRVGGPGVTACSAPESAVTSPLSGCIATAAGSPRPAPRSRKVKRIEEASSLMPLPVTAGYSPVGPGCQVELVPPVGGVDVVLLAGRARSDGGRDARSRPATRNGDSVGGPTARYGSAAKASVAGPRASLRLNRVARTTTAPRAGPAAYWGLLCRKTPPLSRNWPALSSVARPSGVVFS
jgi:hypothetical protein